MTDPIRIILQRHFIGPMGQTCTESYVCDMESEDCAKIVAAGWEKMIRVGPTALELQERIAALERQVQQRRAEQWHADNAEGTRSDMGAKQIVDYAQKVGGTFADPADKPVEADNSLAAASVIADVISTSQMDLATDGYAGLARLIVAAIHDGKVPGIVLSSQIIEKNAPAIAEANAMIADLHGQVGALKGWEKVWDQKLREANATIADLRGQVAEITQDCETFFRDWSAAAADYTAAKMLAEERMKEIVGLRGQVESLTALVHDKDETEVEAIARQDLALRLMQRANAAEKQRDEATAMLKIERGAHEEACRQTKEATARVEGLTKERDRFAKAGIDAMWDHNRLLSEATARAERAEKDTALWKQGTHDQACRLTAMHERIAKLEAFHACFSYDNPFTTSTHDKWLAARQDGAS